MKVMADRRKGNSVGMKRESIREQSTGISKKANTLGYVPFESPALLLSISVDYMDMQDYNEIPDSLKRWRKPNQPSKPRDESMKGWLQEESPGEKKKDSRECNISEAVSGNAVRRNEFVGNQNDNSTKEVEEERGRGNPKLNAMTHYLTQMTEGLIHLLYCENEDQNQNHNKGKIRRRDEEDTNQELVTEEGNKKFQKLTLEIGDCI